MRTIASRPRRSITSVSVIIRPSFIDRQAQHDTDVLQIDSRRGIWRSRTDPGYGHIDVRGGIVGHTAHRPGSAHRQHCLDAAPGEQKEGGTPLVYTAVAADDGRKREDSVKDAAAALDWIAAHPQFDGKRILVSGASYGGYLSVAPATLYSERNACAIDEVGIANFVSFLERTESYRRDRIWPFVPGSTPLKRSIERSMWHRALQTPR
ncbi:MAG: hypothetical protein EXR39_07075 [Betaproteobacteria bacterium]|nr:hypothetical protein [Betaproteobacteria bacterium]